MPESPQDLLLSNAEESLYRPVDLERLECFEPGVPWPPAPKPISIVKRKSLGNLVDEVNGIPPRTESNRETSKSAEDANADSAQPFQVPTATIDEQLPPPRVATAAELFHWITSALLEQTSLSDDAAALIAFWVIATWHQTALRVRPCIVLTGPAHEARNVLSVLRKLCSLAAIVSGFRRSDLDGLRCCGTYLILEPHLNKQTADLLSALTDPYAAVVIGSSLHFCSRSAAVYAGEDPATPQISNGLRIHMSAGNGCPAPLSARVQAILERLPIHLEQYRERNFSVIQNSAWKPSGLSPEIDAIATELGRCIVDAPELRETLVSLMRTQDDQRLEDTSTTDEAILLEALLFLLHQGGKAELFVGEVAATFNGLQKARGERFMYSPRKLGYILSKLKLYTRRLGKDGRGLKIDRVTIQRIHELARMHGGAGLEQSEDNVHCPQCAENAKGM